MAGRPVVRFAGKLSKSGNSPEECEDDFCSAVPRFAIADGASEGSYSSVWAGILVRLFCAMDESDWTDDQVVAWLEQCRQNWSEWENGLADRDLPWFTREKLRTGSFATFIGVITTDTTWHAIAFGDCCLFVVREDQLIAAFPIDRPELFDNTPALLTTATLPNPEQLRGRTGELHSGDRLYLASDALASWFLTDCEAGEKPWVALDGIRTDDDFAIFVGETRQTQTMRNDDVTLLSVEIVD
jgi:hypothetical protein